MQADLVSEQSSAYGLGGRPRLDDEPWRDRSEFTESEYLALDTNHLLEFHDGRLVELPMPNEFHQTIAIFFINLLLHWSPRGKVMTAPFKLKLKVTSGQYREPDVVYLIDRNDTRRGKEFWTGADFVIEIVSPGGEMRDTVEKRAEYAASGIAEYWIVDPKMRTITVLALAGTAYEERGVFREGDVARSVVLTGFEVEVGAVMGAD